MRKFLDTPVTNDQVDVIISAAMRASTSSTLQAWSVVVVRDEGRKRRLADALGGHAYIADASVFLVWVADFARNDAIMREQDVESETLGLIETTLMGALDVGITAQNALLAAESLGLGGVFVGGVRNNPRAVIDELRLPKHAFPVVGMSLGVPDPSEGTGLKPRLSRSAFVHEEQYDTDAWKTAAEQYETEYSAYFESQGSPGRSWIRAMSRRLGTIAGLHGRHTMRESLASQGFDSN